MKSLIFVTLLGILPPPEINNTYIIIQTQTSPLLVVNMRRHISKSLTFLRSFKENFYSYVMLLLFWEFENKFMSSSELQHVMPTYMFLIWQILNKTLLWLHNTQKILKTYFYVTIFKAVKVQSRRNEKIWYICKSLQPLETSILHCIKTFETSNTFSLS